MSRARSARVASRQRPELVTETKTLGAAESGEIYIVSGSSDITLTLPSPEEGSYFKFIYGARTNAGGTAGAHMSKNMVITTADSTHHMHGVVTDLSASEAVLYPTANGSGHRTYTMGTATGPIGGNPKAGSYIECVSDGHQWYVQGFVSGGANAFS